MAIPLSARQDRLCDQLYSPEGVSKLFFSYLKEKPKKILDLFILDNNPPITAAVAGTSAAIAGSTSLVVGGAAATFIKSATTAQALAYPFFGIGGGIGCAAAITLTVYEGVKAIKGSTDYADFKKDRQKNVRKRNITLFFTKDAVLQHFTSDLFKKIIPRHPVVDPDGHIYEFTEIKIWLQQNPRKNPSGKGPAFKEKDLKFAYRTANATTARLGDIETIVSSKLATTKNLKDTRDILNHSQDLRKAIEGNKKKAYEADRTRIFKEHRKNKLTDEEAVNQLVALTNVQTKKQIAIYVDSSVERFFQSFLCIKPKVILIDEENYNPLVHELANKE